MLGSIAPARIEAVTPNALAGVVTGLAATPGHEMKERETVKAGAPA